MENEELKESIDALKESIDNMNQSMSSLDETISNAFGSGNMTDMLQELTETLVRITKQNEILIQLRD